MRALAVLWLALSCALPGIADAVPAAPGGESQEPKSTVHWRLVGPDLQVLAGEGSLSVGQEEWRRITHGWFWTDGTVPVKIPIDQLARNDLPPLETPAAKTTPELSPPELIVRLQGLPPRRPSDTGKAPEREEGVEQTSVPTIDLISAPLEMWHEVPEHLLPVHHLAASERLELPRSPGKPWRLRALARDVGARPLGSWWYDVPAVSRPRVRLMLQPASDVEMALVDERRKKVDGAWLRAFPHPESRSFCLYPASAGEVLLPLLPDLQELSVAAVAPGYLSTFTRAYPSSLPRQLALDPGARVMGRFVDSENLPVAGVEVIAEGWLEGTPRIPYRSQGRTDEDGTFSVAPVPLGRAVIRATHSSFAAFHRALALEPDRNEAMSRQALAPDGVERWTLELGDIRLRRGLGVQVQVEDGSGHPIPGASLSTRPPQDAKVVTDREGRARLSAVDPEAVLEVEADAQGYRPASIRSLPPHPSLLRIGLQPAFTLLGRFLDSAGQPVSNGSLMVRSEQRLQTTSLESDGSFELTLIPEIPYRLSLRGPSTGRYTLSLEPGRPGEKRDLGDLTAPAGRSVTGRLVDGRDGQPVAGARIWTPRPDGDHPMRAWFFGDLLETVSDAEGRFRLAGLGELPARLRIDAAGFARTEVAFHPEPERSKIDLGDIELLPGTTLRVYVEGAARADTRRLLARLDLGRQWRETDMLTAPVHEGVATLPDVPPGEAILTVLRGGDLACEKQVTVAPGVEEQEVTCRVEPIQLRGQVLLGGSPAPGGHLHWSPPAVEGPAFILRRQSPLGAESTSVYGNGRPDLEVPLDDRGTFSTDRVKPGSWEVVWYGKGGVGTTPEVVAVPAEVSQLDLVLEFPDYGLEGRVVDRRGEPVPEARIHEKVTLTTTPVAPDGSFQLLGLGPGRYALQAIQADRRSPWTEAVIPTTGDPEPVELVLGGGADGQSFEARVFTEEGDPARGAFVFVETDRHPQRLLTADSRGRLTVDSGNRAPKAVRFAVYHEGRWLFEPWRRWQELAKEGLRLQIEPGGGLRLIHGGGEPQEITLVSDTSWDVTWLLRRLGQRVRLSPGEPFEFRGLPPGVYDLDVAGLPRSVTIRRNRTEEVEIHGEEQSTP